MDESITELQIKVSYLERHVSELDDVIRELYDQVARLNSELGELRKVSQSLLTEKGYSLEEEKPPHY